MGQIMFAFWIKWPHSWGFPQVEWSIAEVCACNQVETAASKADAIFEPVGSSYFITKFIFHPNSYSRLKILSWRHNQFKVSLTKYFNQICAASYRPIFNISFTDYYDVEIDVRTTCCRCRDVLWQCWRLQMNVKSLWDVDFPIVSLR